MFVSELHYLLFLYFFSFFFFFFNDTATTEIYTLSLHDALPIYQHYVTSYIWVPPVKGHSSSRSEEHTSELQSLTNLVCRLLLEKKKKNKKTQKKEEDKNRAVKKKRRGKMTGV